MWSAPSQRHSPAMSRTLRHDEPSIESKALLAHEGAEISAGRLGILTCLVLRPAVEARFAPALDTALPPIGSQRRASPIIGLDLADQVALAIAVLDDGGRQR